MENSGCEKSASGDRQATPVCQVCGDPLQARAVVQCKKCHTLHHLECWRFNKGCSMYGCGCRSSVKPPSEFDLAGRPSFDIETWTVEGSVAKPAAALGIAIALGLLISVGTNLPAIAAGAMLPLGALMYLLIRHALKRDVLHVDVERGMIRRTVKAFGRTVKTQEDWLAAADVVELHLHRMPHPHAPSMLKWEIFALTTDGRRRLLYRETTHPTVQKAEDIQSVVERLAHFADCTVREFEGKAGPTEQEIQEALQQRQGASDPAALPAAQESPASAARPEETGAAPTSEERASEERNRGRTREGSA